MQILPQRNSNLRELPVAPGNNNITTTATTAGNFNRPGPVPGSNIRPVARATTGPRPAAVVGGLGRGRPPVGLATGGEPASTSRTVVRKEVPQVSYRDAWSETEGTAQLDGRHSSTAYTFLWAFTAYW